MFIKQKIDLLEVFTSSKLRILVKGYLNNKELVGDTWSTTDSMRTLKYLLEHSVNHKSRVHQSDFIAAFLQGKVQNTVFLKLDSRYADYFHNIQITLEDP